MPVLKLTPKQELLKGIPFERVCIKRTKGKKPYAVFDGSQSEQRSLCAPNFNFNVSHEGSYVALASEGLYMCGVDVSAPQCLRRKNPPPFDQTLKLFERCFSPQEYGRIRALYPRLDAMELEFRKYWSLKEAFTKARGDGIAFGLNQTDFQLLGGRAELFMNGEEQTRWRFNLQKFGDHIFSVALGPPDEIIDEYGGFQSMLLRKQLTEDEFEELHQLPEQQFQLIQLDDLIPDSQQSQLQQQYVQ
eukprot:TRINITY_DN8596_c0_g2_i2.p1 TRINITY_DN8596_c0_g2~~TRINITY_DN8596_c0_g2_i2.p1  ORF type:complete len:246 (-),score=29.36 TRINITY_DN8596_c0_g2_i2:327-1064(-)